MPKKLAGQGVLVLFIITATMLGGCASRYMYNKETRLSAPYGNTTDKAIAVDAKQRFVFSKVKDDGVGNLSQVICAEPSPDALSSIVSGVSIGATSAERVLNAALAGAESSASIGLRTQSIQLLRDGMYRICEAAYSGGLAEGEVNLLLKRYQDTMVAILAIESLTGVIRSDQVVLYGRSATSLGEDVAAASEALKVAIDAETDELKKVEEAQKFARDKGEARNQAKNKVDSAESILGSSRDECLDVGKRSAFTGDNLANCNNYIDALSEHESKSKAHVDAENAAEVANEKLKIAQEVTQTQRDILKGARVAASSFVAAEGRVNTTRQGPVISDASAQHISGAVKEIVDKALLRNDVVDTCLRIADSMVNAGESRARVAMLSIAGGIYNSSAMEPLDKQVATLKDLKSSLSCDKVLAAFAARFAGSGR